MIERDLMDIIAEFYGDQYHGHPMRPNVDGNAPLLALLSRLHERVFPDYLFDPEQVLAQGAAQLRGNSRVVENYLPVRFRFPPLTGNGKPLVLFSGINDGGFSLWAEDPVVNRRLQGVLREMEKEGDTIS
ncbi:MAG TPA: hypothetical protein VN829_15840 [Dongiaceae bacterium]|nr:hypothetical protein [Dongiaceae bacterium]